MFPAVLLYVSVFLPLHFMLFLLLSLHYLLLFHILDIHASNILTGSKDPTEIHYTLDLISRRQMWITIRRKLIQFLFPPTSKGHA
jgi:hypothetical protein